MPRTSDALDAAVRRDARIPDGTSAMSQADVLLIADEEIETSLLPVIREVRSEYYVTSTDTALVADTTSYRLPSRAQGATVRDVTLRDAAGNETSIPEISLERRGRYEQAGSLWWPHAIGYCFQGDHIVVLPTPAASGYSLRVRYFREPGKLVLSAAAFRPTAIADPDLSGNVPAGWTTADAFDAIQASSGDWLTTDFTAGAVTEAVGMTGVSSLSTELTTADWIALAGQSPLVQVPDVLYSALVARVTGRVLEAIGRREAAALAYARAEQALERASDLLEPRNEGEHKVAVNWESTLRCRRRY